MAQAYKRLEACYADGKQDLDLRGLVLEGTWPELSSLTKLRIIRVDWQYAAWGKSIIRPRGCLVIEHKIETFPLKIETSPLNPTQPLPSTAPQPPPESPKVPESKSTFRQLITRLKKQIECGMHPVRNKLSDANEKFSVLTDWVDAKSKQMDEKSKQKMHTLKEGISSLMNSESTYRSRRGNNNESSALAKDQNVRPHGWNSNSKWGGHRRSS